MDELCGKRWKKDREDQEKWLQDEQKRRVQENSSHMEALSKFIETGVSTESSRALPERE